MDADESESVSELVNQLPVSYRTALQLQASGMSHDAIAECLRIHPEGVDTILRLAEAKLRRLGQTPD